MSTSDDTPLPLAAVVYPPRSGRIGFLAAFAAALARDGVRVGGVVQERLVDAQGTVVGIDAVDVATGRRVPINRPTETDKQAGACSLDTQRLAETTAMLRDAVARGDELIVVDKFGQEEQKGAGLMDDILAAAGEGIPLLVSVPETALDPWRERTGGLGAVLAPDAAALAAWWAGLER